jgi:transketolase
MIHPSLDPQFFTKPTMRPTRDGFGAGVIEAGKVNESVVLLSADLLDSTRCAGFAKLFPRRFFEMGVAEQNMAAVASGLAATGKIPFIASYATFSPGRNWEQIRTTIAYNDANVKIAGHHAGISVGPDGATHQAIEDIATMRVLANMQVIVPCDAIEAEKATIAAAKLWGPVYLRFFREASPVMTTDTSPFVPGKASVFWEGKKPQALIVGAGPILAHALEAARILDAEDIAVTVLNMHTVKPLDGAALLLHGKKAGAVVSVEEHQVMGGLGSAVAEFFSQHMPLPQEYIGMQNTFGESGKPDDLYVKYRMTALDIAQAVRKVLKRKKSF